MKTVSGKMMKLLKLIAAEPYRGVMNSSDTGRPHPLDPYVDDRGRNTDTTGAPWRGEGAGYMDGRFTHWMPLPAAPGVAGEEG